MTESSGRDDSTPLVYVTDAQHLATLCEGWAELDAIAVDTEFMRTNTFYAKLDLKYAHSLFADDMNQFKVPSFFLSNLALKNTYRIKDLAITVGFQIRNLFDEKYYDNIRLNAFGNMFY